MTVEPTSDERDEVQAMRERVTELILAEGWTVSQADSPDAAWVLIAEDAQKKKVVFGQSAARPDFVELQSRIQISKAHQERFAQMEGDELEEFLWDLRFRLLATDVGFSGISRPFEGVLIRRRLYRDELDQMGSLHRSLQVMNKVMLLVFWMVHRKLSQPAPPEENDGLTVH